jgi:hypothetical protein
MEKGVVIIPCYRRPEFLYVCLEQISKSIGFENYRYMITQDIGGRRSENMPIAVDFLNKNQLKGKFYVRESGRYDVLAKQSYHLMKAYEEAYNLIKDGLVHLIEEDVFIGNQYFRWQETIQRTNPFCSIGTRNNNTHTQERDSLNYYYTIAGRDYQSLAVCFKRDNLKYLLEHMTQDYFNDPIGYVTRTFPKSRIPFGQAEQDSIWRRVIEKNNFEVSFSAVGVAQHSGFYSYHRPGKRITGKMQDRVRLIKDICFDYDKMKSAVLSRGQDIGYFNDSIPIELNREWDGKLIKDQSILT